MPTGQNKRQPGMNTKGYKPLILDNDLKDCLPGTADQWNRFNPRIEQAYRRGYFQGMVLLLEAIEEDHVPFAKCKAFIYRQLFKWRYAFDRRGRSVLKREYPPQIPGSRRNPE